MSIAPDWFDPASGPESSDGASDDVERAERAGRAAAATIAARASRAAVASSEVARKASVTGLEIAEEPYSGWRLAAGALGRMVLSFVAGCLVVTLLPLVLGWRPYVVKSGSMEPRIKVGDVIIASPDQKPQDLLGRVTVFHDPAVPSNVKSHRVVALNPDGTLTTKGDANPTPDPVAVPPAQVTGIGRLLVRWAGLPLVWVRTGQFLFLALLVAGLGAAALAVARDDERDDESGDEPGDRDDSGDEPARRVPGARTAARLRRRTARRRARLSRMTFGVVGAGVLLLPGTSAAFSATTRTAGSVWTVPSYKYTNEVKALNPYLYWKLGDTGGTAADSSGNGRTGTYAGTYTRSAPGGTPDDIPNAAVTATNSSACINTTSATVNTGPSVFTLVVWFKAPSSYTGGGKLIGFEAPRTGVGVFGSTGSYDRHIYMDGAGKIWFGVYNNAFRSVGSTASYNDNTWHMAAATIGPSGMALYVDAVLRGTNANTAVTSSSGWWRVGCGNLAGWGASWTGANNPGGGTTTGVNVPFQASLDEAAVFSGTALTAAQVSYLYWTR